MYASPSCPLPAPAVPGSARYLLLGLVLCLLLCLPASTLAQGVAGPQAAADTSRAWVFTPHDDDVLVRVIVTFAEPPALLAGPAAATEDGLYARRFGELAAALATEAGKQASGGAAEIVAAFTTVFFGATVRLPERLLAALAALPYVRSVHPDAPVAAHLDHSVGQIHADDVWEELGVRGEGVTVGIIDSGVDYTHPALGGGFGPGFRVVGGYDFVNDDPDPMDDAGHGTHVAGIVAADGEGIRGVAPGARLVAYKVLGADGRGTTTDILRAIEATVDPNGDGDPSDRLDVVNVSLGSDFGTPDDPTALAVDHATQLGVTFVVSAGNAGGPPPTQGKEDNYYYDGSESIGSPGTSRRAITVGAVDAVDAMASFSSRGPVALTFAGKPDVTAPGVSIRSLAPGGGFAAKNGTSMSAPHVAGVAALLKALHPAWSPAQIKAALMNTAVDGAHPVMRQGAGRVDALRAATTGTLVLPPDLSFGMDDPSAGTWTARQTVRVYNRRATAQAYTVSFTGLRAGITLGAEPSAFTVAPGDSAAVTVTLAVDNGAVPLVPDDIEVYGGAAHVTGTLDVLRLPWSFSRTSVLALTFSDPEAQFAGSSPGGSYFVSGFASPFNKVRWIDARRAEVYGVERGVYDVVAVLPSADGPARVVVRGGVPVGPAGGALHLDAAEARLGVYFDGVDETGTPLRLRPGAQQMLVATLPGAGWISAHARPGDAPGLLLSPVPPAFRLRPVQTVADVSGSRRIYVPQFETVAGLSADLHAANAPAAYLTQHLRFRTPAGVPQVTFFTEVMTGYSENGSDYTYGGLLAADTLPAPGGEVEAQLFIAAPTGGATGGATGRTYFEAPVFHLGIPEGDRTAALLSTLPLSAADGQIRAGWPSAVHPLFHRSAGGDTLTFGASPVFVRNQPLNNTFGSSSIHFSPHFAGALHEERFHEQAHGRYAIYDASERLVRAAPLAEMRTSLDVPPGRYRVEITSEAPFVHGYPGRVTLVNRFDLRKEIPDAPTFVLARLLDGAGRARETFRRGEAARLVFAATVRGMEAPEPAHTRAYARRHGASEWQPLPVRPLDDAPSTSSTRYEVDLSAMTQEDSAAIDLRIETGGRHDNTAELRLEPAFAVGRWQRPVETEDPAGEPLPAVPTLGENYPDPFTAVTHIPFALSRPAFVTLTIHDLLGRRVATLVAEQRPAGRYEVAWDGAGAASGVYFYRLAAGGRVTTRKMVLVR